MFPTSIQYFLHLVALLFFSYSLGKLLINATTLREKREPYFQIFLSLVLGFMLISAVVASYRANFKTVLLTYFFLIGAFLYWFKQPGFQFRLLFKTFFPKESLVILAGSLVIYTAAFIAVAGNSPLGFIFPWRDTINYAIVSNHIYNTGVESFILSSSVANNATANPVPYHYFELWLNAAVSESLKGLYMLDYMLVMAVAFRVAIFTGLLAFWNTLVGKTGIIGIIVCFLMLYLKGIFLPDYANWFKEVEVLNQLSVNTEGIKFLPGYIFFLAFALCILRKELLLGFLFILAFPVAHIVSTPGILTAAGSMFILYLLYFTKWYETNAILRNRLLILISGTALFIAGFYFLFGAKEEGSNSQNLFLVIKTFNFSQLAKIWYHFKHYCIKFFVVTWPYFLFLLPAWFFKRKDWKSEQNKNSLVFILLFAGIALFTGALLGGILYQNFEGHQLLQILVGVLNISLCLLIIFTIGKWANYGNKMLQYGIYAGVAVLLFLSQNPLKIFYPTGRAYAQNLPYDNYSNAYLAQIDQYFQTHPDLTPIGSCIMGAKDLDYYYAYSPFYFTLGLYLPYITNNTFVFSMSEYNTQFPTDPQQQKRAQDLTSAGAFYKFVADQKKKNSFVSIDQSQLTFIEKHKIGYVILSPNAPKNTLLEQRLQHIITDSNTGERFAIIK